MRKHIEYIEVTHHGMKGILITEQSHTMGDFGYGGTFKSKHGIILISDKCPDCIETTTQEDKEVIIMYVHGWDDDLNSSVVIFEKESTFDKVVQAIKEYNETEFPKIDRKKELEEILNKRK